MFIFKFFQKVERARKPKIIGGYEEKERNSEKSIDTSRWYNLIL